MAKLGNLYDLAAMDRFCDSERFQSRNSISAAGFSDSDSGVILARNLTAVDPKIFEQKYPELSFINSGVSVDNTGGYARRIQSLKLRELGGFTTSGDASANKGQISLTAEDSFLNVIVREAQSTWQDDDIKEAQLQNRNLPQEYVQAHNRAYQRELDEIGLVGKDSISSGLLNYSGFATSSAAGTIDTLTAEQKYDVFAQLITDQNNKVNNIPEYSAARVIMPVRVMNDLSATILNSAGSERSVMMALQGNFPNVQFISSFRADTVANGGNLSESATVAYSNSDDAMKVRVPVPLTIGEIIKVRSFDFTVDSKYRIAGLDVLEDQAGTILTGL